MKNSEVLGLKSQIEGLKQSISQTVQSVLQNKGDVVHIPFKFSYALSRNSKRIESYEKEILEPFRKEMRRLDEEEKGDKYKEEYIKICEATGKKDEKGNYQYVYETNGLRVPLVEEGKDNERKKKLKALKEKYKSYIEGVDKIDSAYKKLMEEEADIELYKISIDYIPDVLTPQQVDILLPILDDTET